MKYYLMCILFVIISCKGQKNTVPKNNTSNQVNDEGNTMVLLLQAEYSEFDVTETMVIKDEKRLRSFYAKINKTRKPRLPVPKIDFLKEMVIIHCNGDQKTSGMSTLTKSKETDTEILLTSKLENNTSEVSKSIVTNPFCVYKMPLTGKKVLVVNDIK